MNIIFLSGILGSLALVTGSAWPEQAKEVVPYRSTKNWLFAIGGLVMLAYAIMNYMADGAVFFVFLEVLVVLASVLMMLNTSDKVDIAVIGTTGVLLIAWSFYLFEGYNTLFFIAGLTGVGLGYALETGTLKRMLALTLGSAMIALFSYIEMSWIFFWLNVFFAVFSAYYMMKLIARKRG